MHQRAISASFLGFFLPHMAPCEARTPGALHGDARPQVSPWHPWLTGASEALSIYQLGKQRPAREFHGENVTWGRGYRDAGRAEKPNPDGSPSWTSPHTQAHPNSGQLGETREGTVPREDRCQGPSRLRARRRGHLALPSLQPSHISSLAALG